MPHYENVFIARQDVSAAAVEALAERFAAVIKENGGEVSKKEIWGLRNLAYRIKKNRKGHYVLFNIDAPWPAVEEMERQMRINEDVLRFLTLRVDALDPGPSIMMRARSARDDRPRRDDRGRRHGHHDRGPDEGHRGGRESEAAGARDEDRGRGNRGRGDQGRGDETEKTRAPRDRPAAKSDEAADPKGEGETGARETGARENGARETGARENGARENGARENGARENGDNGGES